MCLGCITWPRVHDLTQRLCCCPRSALIKEDGTYAPAHLLPDAALERAGRAGCKVRRTDTLGANAKTAALVSNCASVWSAFPSSAGWGYASLYCGCCCKACTSLAIEL